MVFIGAQNSRRTVVMPMSKNKNGGPDFNSPRTVTPASLSSTTTQVTITIKASRPEEAARHLVSSDDLPAQKTDHPSSVGIPAYF